MPHCSLPDAAPDEIDRVVAILLGLESIREVIAFPKNQKAVDPMTQAPSPVAERQLKELGIKIR